jgi:hypothetical protein
MQPVIVNVIVSGRTMSGQHPMPEELDSELEDELLLLDELDDAQQGQFGIVIVGIRSLLYGVHFVAMMLSTEISKSPFPLQLTPVTTVMQPVVPPPLDSLPPPLPPEPSDDVPDPPPDPLEVPDPDVSLVPDDPVEPSDPPLPLPPPPPLPPSLPPDPLSPLPLPLLPLPLPLEVLLADSDDCESDVPDDCGWNESDDASDVPDDSELPDDPDDSDPDDVDDPDDADDVALLSLGDETDSELI